MVESGRGFLQRIANIIIGTHTQYLKRSNEKEAPRIQCCGVFGNARHPQSFLFFLCDVLTNVYSDRGSRHRFGFAIGGLLAF